MTESGTDSAWKGALRQLTRPPLLYVVAALQLEVILAIAFGHLSTLPELGTTDALGTGDFLAFYTAADMVSRGDGAELYSPEAQRAAQARLLVVPSEDFQPYWNPPLLAAALSLVVPLGYRASFLLFDLVNLVGFGVAMGLLAQQLPRLAPSRLDALGMAAVAIGYPPVARTMFGGQNTILTLALLICLYVFTRRGSNALAALALGLLTYKPQYAVGMGLALLFAGRYRVVFGGALVGIAHYLVGAMICGFAWPVAMLGSMAAFIPFERIYSGPTHFSWMRVTEHVLPEGIGSVVGPAGAVAVLAAMLVAGRRSTDFAAAFAVAVTGTMLASSHLQYYDAGLLVLPVLLLLDRPVARGPTADLALRLALALAYVGYPIYQLGKITGFQPLLLILLAVFGWALRSSLTQGRIAASSPAVAIRS